MNTRYLMRASMAFLGVLGIAATFVPQEILAHAGLIPSPAGTLLVQFAGALYLGFAMLDWAAQGQVMGGIYGRPVVLANFMHYMVGAFAALKVVMAAEREVLLLVLCAAYCAFALLFGLVMVSPPRDAGARGPQ